jgi:uncharacterized protein with FMN-binding domain
MMTMPTRSTVFAALLCLLLVGCGGSKAPLAQTERDSAASVTVAPAPTVTPGPETTRSETPAGTSSAAPARDTVPTMVTRAFAAAVSVQYLSRPFPHRVIRDSAERVLGYETFSDSAGVTALGYAGPVPVQVFFDSQGKPVRIYILENSETPAYMDIISGAGLMDRLLVFDPAKPDSVDAVTLATSSSRAIVAGVTGLASRVSVELAGKPSSRPR